MCEIKLFKLLLLVVVVVLVVNISVLNNYQSAYILTISLNRIQHSSYQRQSLVILS